MGQAKMRGNNEERLSEAMKRIREDIERTVDEDLFLYCSNIYSAAANMTMPVENPSARPIINDGDKTYAFSDIPVNRGMLAVNKELTEMNMGPEVKYPMTLRLMHFGDVLLPNPLLEKWIKPNDEPDSLSVAECLIRACAKAKLIVDNEHIGWDFEDVARIAAEIEIRLNAEEKTEQLKTDKN
jgi:hypothetical protein